MKKFVLLFVLIVVSSCVAAYAEQMELMTYSDDVFPSDNNGYDYCDSVSTISDGITTNDSSSEFNNSDDEEHEYEQNSECVDIIVSSDLDGEQEITDCSVDKEKCDFVLVKNDNDDELKYISSNDSDSKEDQYVRLSLIDYCEYKDLGSYVDGMDTFYIPDYLSTIGSEAFSGLSAEVIVVPDSCTNIGELAFSSCENLCYVFIPDDLKESISEDAIFDSINAKVIFYSNGENSNVSDENTFEEEIIENEIEHIVIQPELSIGITNTLRIDEQPKSVIGSYGEIVAFHVVASHAEKYQWQACTKNSGWYDITEFTGCTTDTMYVQVIENRTTLMYRCLITGTYGETLYTNDVCIDIKDTDVIVNGNETVQYDVPLYYQGKYNLCWDYSQQMVEDFILGIMHTDAQVDKLCHDRAVDFYGDEWNNGGLPTDESWDVLWDDEITIVKLYGLLVKNGPLYANYNNNKIGHMVVVTGVDLENKKVTTNNPWRISGEQSYKEFVNMFDTGNHKVSYSLPLLYVSWAEWQ